jgi:nicotinamidase-related amidase
MAKIRSGKKAALLVIDVQNGVVQNAYNRNAVVSNISKVIRKARDGIIPIIFVQHTNADELPENSAQWQIVNELEIGKEDYRITKRYNSAFEDTGLEKILENLSITEVIITGAATNWCIRATTFSALTKGYDLTLISDAHTTENINLSKERTLYAEDIISEFNIGIKYIEYPEIQTRVLSSDELVIKKVLAL